MWESDDGFRVCYVGLINVRDLTLINVRDHVFRCGCTTHVDLEMGYRNCMGSSIGIVNWN